MHYYKTICVYDVTVGRYQPICCFVGDLQYIKNAMRLALVVLFTRT
jgi:hypothetical protein